MRFAAEKKMFSRTVSLQRLLYFEYGMAASQCLYANSCLRCCHQKSKEASRHHPSCIQRSDGIMHIISTCMAF